MKCYIIATPIGNLADITYRAVEILRDVDTVVCEDTRQTKKLLAHFEINKPLISWHQHSRNASVRQIIGLIAEGKDIAYVSDAGTPGISDPGGKLVELLHAHFGNQLSIVPIPGPSAVVAALSVSGFPTDTFQFLGFIPHKKGRETFLKHLQTIRMTTVFYESVHRIEKLLEQLVHVLPDRQIVVARELTKKFESVYRGTPIEVQKFLTQDPVKGEFVVIVRGK